MFWDTCSLLRREWMAEWRIRDARGWVRLIVKSHFPATFPPLSRHTFPFPFSSARIQSSSTQLSGGERAYRYENRMEIVSSASRTILRRCFDELHLKRITESQERNKNIGWKMEKWKHIGIIRAPRCKRDGDLIAILSCSAFFLLISYLSTLLDVFRIANPQNITSASERILKILLLAPIHIKFLWFSWK